MTVEFKLKRPLITIMSDFGWSSQGVGIMKAIAYGICPRAVVIDITHDIDSFNVIEGARQVETLFNLPCGIHVCVVDPGVGTLRKILAIETKRGDILIGPDNGVLLPAVRRFKGFVRAVSVENQSFMLKPILKTFQGRDIMIPVAAAIANGVHLDELGPPIKFQELQPAPYDDAEWINEDFHAIVIYVDKKFGAVFLNILSEDFEKHGFVLNSDVEVITESQIINLPIKSTFGMVKPGESFLFKDEYGGVGMATNLKSFSKIYGLKLGDKCVLRLKNEGDKHG